jgi:VanZ family protein
MFLVAWLIFILMLSIVSLKGPKTTLPVDKAVHFILYGLTSIFFYRHLIKKIRKNRALFLSILCSSLYGGALEVVQHFAPGRAFSPGDMAANAAGAITFCLLYAAISRDQERR